MSGKVGVGRVVGIPVPLAPGSHVVHYLGVDIHSGYSEFAYGHRYGERARGAPDAVADVQEVIAGALLAHGLNVAVVTDLPVEQTGNAYLGVTNDDGMQLSIAIGVTE